MYSQCPQNFTFTRNNVIFAGQVVVMKSTSLHKWNMATQVSGYNKAILVQCVTQNPVYGRPFQSGKSSIKPVSGCVAVYVWVEPAEEDPNRMTKKQADDHLALINARNPGSFARIRQH